MQIKLRSTNYAVTSEIQDTVTDTEAYYDLTTVGRLMNAVRYAITKNVAFQLAELSLDASLTPHTLFLTGGLLYKALCVSDRLVNEYKGQVFVQDFERLLDLFKWYDRPGIILDMTADCAFEITAVEGEKESRFAALMQAGKVDLFPNRISGRLPLAVASVLTPDERKRKKSLGKEVNIQPNLESVIEFIADEFTLAAEEFIFGMAKKLGVGIIPQPTEEIPLAA